MIDTFKYLRGNPITLSEAAFMLEDPAGSPTCDVCASLRTERAEAKAAKNWSKVSDVNVELRHHIADNRECGGSRHEQ